MSSERASPVISSFSTPLPSEPVTCTCGLDQVRTTMRPLMFSIRTWPSALSGRVSLMGVAAKAGATANIAMAPHRRMDMQLLLELRRVFMRLAHDGALGQLQAGVVGAAQLLQQEHRTGIGDDRALDLRDAAVESGDARLDLRRQRRSVELAQCGLVLIGDRT